MSLISPVEAVSGDYQLWTLGVWVTVLIGEDGFVLVDAGGRGSLGLVTLGLRALGAFLEQVRLIILMDCHPDHTGGLAKLVEAKRPLARFSEYLERVQVEDFLRSAVPKRPS